MAVSKTQIVNLALSHLHENGTLDNVDTENTTAAVNGRLWWEPARQQALVDMDLGFARKRLSLAVHAIDPPADWTYRYQFPADCIQPRYLENPAGRGLPPIPFLVEQASDGTRSILTNLGTTACLVYTRDADDPAFFYPHFTLALSYLLAHYLAGPITGKKVLKREMMENYMLAIGTAGSAEANVTAAGTEGSPDPDWIKNR